MKTKVSDLCNEEVLEDRNCTFQNVLIKSGIVAPVFVGTTYDQCLAETNAQITEFGARFLILMQALTLFESADRKSSASLHLEPLVSEG